jgi:hypothetical protein
MVASTVFTHPPGAPHAPLSHACIDVVFATLLIPSYGVTTLQGFPEHDNAVSILVVEQKLRSSVQNVQMDD